MSSSSGVIRTSGLMASWLAGPSKVGSSGRGRRGQSGDQTNGDRPATAATHHVNTQAAVSQRPS